MSFLKYNTAQIYFFICFLLVYPSFSQELPPISRFDATMYRAGTQNWEITFDNHNYVYFANNEGLLEYNGSEWSLYPSPNESIVRSVLAVGDKIYSGCYMEFGYWQRKNNGRLQYTSLSQKIKKQLVEDEHFWNILTTEHFVLFQSFQRIYIYDTKNNTFKIVKNHPYIFKCFKVDNTIVFQSIGKGLFEIINGKIHAICTDETIKNNRITEIYATKDAWFLQTEKAGILKLQNNHVAPYHLSPEIDTNTIFCSKKLSSGNLALGTISNGLFIISPTGETLYHITQSKGLGNNTVLSINEDASHNLWLGLDNGIVCLNMQSAITNFKDDWGKLGTVYTAIVYKNCLYIGTNQGLYCRHLGTNSQFEILPQTKGQVWSLQIFDDQLFCGHDLGTFIVQGTSARLIYSKSGTWKINQIPNHPNLLMQGNYNGLSILEKKDNQWYFKEKIKGLDISCRYFELLQNKIFVCHEYKGVLEAIPSNDYGTIKRYTFLKNPPKGKNIGLIKYLNTLYFTGKQGIFEYNTTQNKFIKNAHLSTIFKTDSYLSGKMSIDNSNTLWLFAQRNVYNFSPSNFSKKLKINKIPIPQSEINSMLGYENITEIAKGNYLIGKTDGYFVLDMNTFTVQNLPLSITKLTANRIGKNSTILPINNTNELNYRENNITISFNVPQYNPFIDVEYSYLLDKQENKWSAWSNKSSVNFKNLEPGDYTFKVKAKIANTKFSEEKTITFTINEPWYSNTWAKMFYFLAALLAAYYINKAYKKYYQNQREKLIEENNRLLEISALEHEKELMILKNQKLEEDVNAINKELAVSTLSLIKKDELLKLIQEDLNKTVEEQPGNKLKSVISTINQNIKQENSWNTFREAFDNLDKDFLKRLKELHPSLTPSDLKLCAYLRLNLSSKEIAPMLNISIRSVEIKRYRLRKKLNLLHDDGLVSYILNV